MPLFDGLGRQPGRCSASTPSKTWRRGEGDAHGLIPAPAAIPPDWHRGNVIACPLFEQEWSEAAGPDSPVTGPAAFSISSRGSVAPFLAKVVLFPAAESGYPPSGLTGQGRPNPSVALRRAQRRYSAWRVVPGANFGSE